MASIPSWKLVERNEDKMSTDESVVLKTSTSTGALDDFGVDCNESLIFTVSAVHIKITTIFIRLSHSHTICMNLVNSFQNSFYSQG